MFTQIDRTQKLESQPLITGEQLAQMPNTEMCELVEGRIVNGMPTGKKHGGIEALIAFFLISFTRQSRLGEVLTGEVGVYTKRNPDTVRGVDVAFISTERASENSTDGFLRIAPELVVEILSPTNTRSEMKQKVAEYFGADVLLVWIVDPQKEQIRVYSSAENFDVLTSDDTLTGGTVLPGFEVQLSEIFGA